MPIQTACPKCSAKYNLGDKTLGKTVRCKKCSEPFEVAPLEEPEEQISDDPAPARKGGRRRDEEPAEVVLADDDDDFDDDFDDEPRPRKRRSREDDDDLDFDDEPPSRRRGRGRGRGAGKGLSTGVWIAIGGGGFLFLILALVGILWATGVIGGSITLETVGEVKKDMSISEVKSILGSPDAEKTEDNRTMMIWVQKNAVVTVTFRDGKVRSINSDFWEPK